MMWEFVTVPLVKYWVYWWGGREVMRIQKISSSNMNSAIYAFKEMKPAVCSYDLAGFAEFFQP